MTKELRDYIRLETLVAAALNFFINGMIAALIYHKADAVSLNSVSISIDLLSTCLLILILAAYFCRASLKRTKTAGILEHGGMLVRRIGRLLAYPLLYGLVLGTLTAVVLTTLTLLFFALLGVYELPFYWYVAIKALFAMILGSGVTVLTLNAGMRKP